MNYLLRLAKRFYQSLPLSYQTKVVLRDLVVKYSPKVLLLDNDNSIPLPVWSLKTMPQAMTEPLTNQIAFAKTINIPTSKTPMISIIIPVYGNNIDNTLRCLASIGWNPPQSPFEVIIVDDCSPDNTVEMLRNVNNIRVARNNNNQGFIRSCNLGASMAKGEYLYLLNNDTEVITGSMDELLRTFYEFPGTGLVGSKLIYPDGRLKEAGGILFQNGNAHNIDSFQDPLLPAYNYAREIDYCSGASIMVPKSIFSDVGGFDECDLSTYAEDFNLAFNISSKGYRVMYQPLSTVIHDAGVTSGKCESEDINAYPPIHSKKRYSRWKNQLQTLTSIGSSPHGMKGSGVKHRVLVIDHFTPTPNHDAGSLLFFNFMFLLRKMGFYVTFIPEDNFLYMSEYTSSLQRAGIEALYAPYVTSVEDYLKKFGKQFSLIFLFRPYVFLRHIRTVRKRCPQAKIIFHTLDLHFLRMAREAEVRCDTSKKKAADNIKEIELEAIRTSDAAIVVSTAEYELIHQRLPDAKLYLFPLILDATGTESVFSERNDIVFVGNFQHPPNVDAVLYFIDEIMPLVRQHLPGVRFHVVGKNPSVEINTLSSEDIIITGYIEDLNSFLDKIKVSVAPIRFGAGIKGKIASAMSAGLPVVATSLAIEGMSLNNGENILVADNAENFANAIATLYQDEALWNQLSRNGQEFAKNTWGVEAAWKNLSNILSDIGIRPIRNAYPLTFYTESNLKKAETVNRPIVLNPIASIKNRSEYEYILPSDSLQNTKALEKMILDSNKNSPFSVKGFCVPCNKEVPFLVGMQFEGKRQQKYQLLNWHKQLQCPLCGMNNRQRLVATLLMNFLKTKNSMRVYFMEQATPFYTWAVRTYNTNEILGSEYLGHTYESGTVIQGVRHEDVEHLSLLDNSINLIISNDVFEHVPHPSNAFSECARVLKPDGVLYATVPFYIYNDISVSRSQIINGRVKHVLPPLYHENPISSEGSLVFTEFGWDVLREMKASGFSEARIEVYASSEYGHLGDGQMIFIAKK